MKTYFYTPGFVLSVLCLLVGIIGMNFRITELKRENRLLLNQVKELKGRCIPCMSSIDGKWEYVPCLRKKDLINK